MPTLTATEPLFTDRQETILRALGTARSSKPNIDLAPICRFISGKATIYVSDCDTDGTLYGAVTVIGERPQVGRFSRAELMMMKRKGNLYRGDLDAATTIAEYARIAHARETGEL